MSVHNTKFLDCTLRDGGYYNDWDFSHELICEYLQAMVALNVDFVEIGFRTIKNNTFKGGCAFSTDSYIRNLEIPLELKNKIAVMINGSELVPDQFILGEMTQNEILSYQHKVLEKLFAPKKNSLVTLVRIACHVYEFEACLSAANWLKNNGYYVGFNLMQVADSSEKEIIHLAKLASNYPIDVLYFADSMGSLTPETTKKIIFALRQNWQGELGIHTHDNMGQALANTIQAVKDGVVWVDGTVTGMGRGAGNVQTEYLSIALESLSYKKLKITKLLEVIQKHFSPMQINYGWGTNPYYYLAGKYGIHPSYIQEMLADNRYSEEDILSVIEYLKLEGGKKFNLDTLEAARHFYIGEPRGTWNPDNEIIGKEVLILGTGPGVAKHRNEIEAFIKLRKPFVIALNTQQNIDEKLIDIRAACHPVRLLADCHEHLKLPQPLVMPASMLPQHVKEEFNNKLLLDFGISIQPNEFVFNKSYSTLPALLVFAYALAIATSGKAKKIFLAGFDGYGADDPRRKEIDYCFNLYMNSKQCKPVVSITPTRYDIPTESVYAEEKLI